MADWPPIPDVPSAVDSPFPPEWQQAQPYAIDGAAPAPETVPPWEQKLPEQQLGASLEAPLGAQTPEAQFPPTATPQGNEVATPPWEQPQTPQNENAPWWAQAAQGTAKQVGAPENILSRKADQENAQKASDPEAAAINEQYRIKAEAERKQAEGELNLARDYKQQLAMDQLQTQREGAAAQAAEQKVGEAWDAVSKAKIDPQALWHSMGAAQKVSAVIGAAIGGFLSARQQSGRNQFMDTYNQRVAESIQAQEANLANMRQAAAGQQSVYGMMLDRFKDAQTARHMTAATMYDAGIKQLSAEVAQHKSELTKQDGVLAMIGLQKERDANIQAAKDKQFDTGMKVLEAQQKQQQLDEQARNNKAQTGLGFAQLNEQKRQNDTGNTLRAAELQQKKEEADAKTNGQAVPIKNTRGEVVGYSTDPKAASAAEAQFAAIGQLGVMTARGRELFKDGWARPGTTLRAQQETFNVEYFQTRKAANGDISAPNDKDASRYGMPTEANLTGTGPGNAVDMLNEAERGAKRKAAVPLRQAGIPDSVLQKEGLIDTPNWQEKDTKPTSPVVIEQRKKDEARTQKVTNEVSADSASMVPVITGHGVVLQQRSQMQEGVTGYETVDGRWVSIDDPPTEHEFPGTLRLKHGIKGSGGGSGQAF